MTNSKENDEADEHDQHWIVRLTQYASADIDAVTAFLSENLGDEYDEYADAWQNGILEAIGTLSRFPASHSIVTEFALFDKTVRQFLYTGSRRYRRGAHAWRVLFALRQSEQDGSVVYVIHVRHSAQRPMTAEEAQTIIDVQ